MTTKIHPAHPPEAQAPAPEPDVPHGLHPVLIAFGVSLLATAASHSLPLDYASGGVALVFLVSTYALCLRVEHTRPPAHYGLSLGGLMEPRAVSPLRLFRELLQAFGVATLVALIIFPPFWWGFLHWYDPAASFDLTRAFVWEGMSQPTKWLFEMSLWHLLGVALPEEAFFRGYLQSSLQDRWRTHSKADWRLGPIQLNWAIVVSSVLFALGHLATEPHPARLAVFFPSLLFGVVRRKTGGIGAAVFLHAQCNLFSQWLAQGYGLS